MFGFEDSHREVYQGDSANKSSWSHELIAGAAAFETAKHFESTRPEDKHKLTKEMFAAFAGAETDKLAETKGLDFLDREKAKHQAKKNAEAIYDQSFGSNAY